MTAFKHVWIETEGEVNSRRYLCGAQTKSLPERYMASCRYLHEVKACPKCKEMDPTLKGWDEYYKEVYGDAWDDYERRHVMYMQGIEESRKPVAQQQPVMEPVIAHVNTTLYLRDYLTGRDSQ